MLHTYMGCASMAWCTSFATSPHTQGLVFVRDVLAGLSTGGSVENRGRMLVASPFYTRT